MKKLLLVLLTLLAFAPPGQAAKVEKSDLFRFQSHGEQNPNHYGDWNNWGRFQAEWLYDMSEGYPAKYDTNMQYLSITYTDQRTETGLQTLPMGDYSTTENFVYLLPEGQPLSGVQRIEYQPVGQSTKIILTFDHSGATSDKNSRKVNLDWKGLLHIYPGVKMTVSAMVDGVETPIKSVTLYENYHDPYYINSASPCFGLYNLKNDTENNTLNAETQFTSRTYSEFTPDENYYWNNIEYAFSENGPFLIRRKFNTSVTSTTFKFDTTDEFYSQTAVNNSGDKPAMIIDRIMVVTEQEATPPAAPDITAPTTALTEMLTTASPASINFQPGETDMISNDTRYFYAVGSNIDTYLTAGTDENFVNNLEWYKNYQYITECYPGNYIYLTAPNTKIGIIALRDGLRSPVTTREYKWITVTEVNKLGDLNAANDGQLVNIKETLRYYAYEIEANPTTGNRHVVFYVFDEDSKAITYHYFDSQYQANRPTSAKDFFTSFKPENRDIYYVPERAFFGIYHHNNGGPAEVEISSRMFNYSLFCNTSYRRNPNISPVVVREITNITEDDYNHLVTLRNARYVENNSMIEVTHGGITESYKLYPMYTSSQVAIQNANLTDGTSYSVTGYVGTVGGSIAIFPTAINKCPISPVLLAPNKIDSDHVNMISPSITLTIDPQGADEATVYDYVITGDNDAEIASGSLSQADATDPAKGIVIDGSKFTTDCHLTVTAKLGTVAVADPIKVTFTKHDAEESKSIAEFKGIYIGNEKDLPTVSAGEEFTPTAYHQLTGNAVILEVTPEYLYLRDYDADRDETANPYTSANYLLVHNTNGWGRPTVGTDDRTLQAGDVITGIALIPAVTRLDNLISESSNFARTVRYTGTSIDPATIKPETRTVSYTNSADADYYTAEDLKFTQADRMRYFTLEGVKVVRIKKDASEIGPDADASDPNTKWTYKMRLGSDNENEWPEITLNVFTVRDGWATAFGDDVTDRLEFPFNITGVAMLNGSDDKFAVALINFEGSAAPAAPVVTLEGVEDNGGAEPFRFLYTGRIAITGADAADQIWYTTDGSDALQNAAGRRLFTGDYEGANSDLNLVGAREQVIVNAFAVRPGSTTSQSTVRVFERSAIEREFIANILKGTDGQWFHFNGNARVVKVHGEWMFIRGVLGQYLPIYNEQGWEGFKKDDYLTDFVVGYAKENNNIFVKATDECPFGQPIEKPADIDDIDTDAPETVNSISASNARRLVTLRRAKVALVSDDARAAQWVIEGQDDAAQQRNLAVGKLGDMTGDELKDGGVFDITGFVMYGDDSQLEIWPISATELTSTPGVTVEVSEGTQLEGTGSELTARFYPMTEITLACEDKNVKPQIYYAFYNEKETAESDVVWSPYVRPIIVTDNNARLHAYAQLPGQEASEHTHVNLIRSSVSGDVEFDVAGPDKEGNMLVSLSAASETAAASSKFYYSIADGKADREYTGPFTVAETAIVYARIQEPGKLPGAISHALVIVPEKVDEPVDPDTPTTPEQPENPADRISGRVKFELTDEGQGTVLVKISPADENLEPGKYEIWYTTKTGVTLPEGGELYTDPGFEMTESGLVMAVLVEKATGKAVGQTCEVTVWVVPAPTGIDSVGADSTDSVRVEGSSIIAPEGSEVYDIAGRRVRPDSLRPGIYIVRTPDGKAIKLTVNN